MPIIIFGTNKNPPKTEIKLRRTRIRKTFYADALFKGGKFFFDKNPVSLLQILLRKFNFTTVFFIITKPKKTPKKLINGIFIGTLLS